MKRIRAISPGLAKELGRIKAVKQVVGALPCGLEVYVRTDERAARPHFHVCDVETSGLRFHAAIGIDDREYVVRDITRYPYLEWQCNFLDDRERVALASFLAQDRIPGMTNWQYVVSLWNSIGHGRKVDPSRPMPKYDCSIGELAHSWFCNINTIDTPILNGDECRVYVRDARWEDWKRPHIHVCHGLAGGLSDFELEVSIPDLLVENRFSLISLRDIREPGKEFACTNPAICSWKGYEVYRDELLAYLMTEGDGKSPLSYPGETNFDRAVRIWNWENRPGAIQEWLKDHGLTALPKYKRLMETCK